MSNSRPSRKLSTSASAANYVLLSCSRHFLEVREKVEEELLRAVGSSKELISATPTPGAAPPPTATPPPTAQEPPPPPGGPSPRDERPGAGAGARPPVGRTPPPGGPGRDRPTPPTRELPSRAAAPKLDDRMETIMAQAAQKLLTALKQLTEVVSTRAPHISSEIVRESQFVLAGYADESLLHHPSGKLTQWRNHLLEETMFGSRTAGETFFDRLAKVSYETYTDSVILLALYLAVLRMGFLGRFRGLRDRGELDRLRIRAVTRITEEVNFDPSSNVPVSPTAYDSTLRLSEIVKTPLRGAWREVFIACVILCLSASIVGWIHFLTPLDTQIDRVLLKVGISTS